MCRCTRTSRWRRTFSISCFDYPADRNRIVYTELNFPSVMYVAEGERRRGAVIVEVPSDDGIGVPTERLLGAIDERTRIVSVSHVLFRSAFIQDAQAIARRCREVGAVVVARRLSVGRRGAAATRTWGADGAVGGSVKWLCGGPGAGFLWVHPRLSPELEPTLTGWQADVEPFAFRPGKIRHAEGAWRFLTGTPNIPALHACRPGYEIVAEIGVERIRERSLALTQVLIDAADEAGLEVRSPRDPSRRAGTVSIWHPEAERIHHELLRREVICDYRPGGGIRFGPHFFNTEEECARAVALMRELAGKS